MNDKFSTILSAVKPRERSDQYVILAALYSLGAGEKPVSVQEIRQLLKLHLRNKLPANISASLRNYSGLVEPVDTGPPMRWGLKTEGLERLRDLSELVLATPKSESAFESDVAIICALEQPEFSAVKDAFGGDQAWKEVGDSRHTIRR